MKYDFCSFTVAKNWEKREIFKDEFLKGLLRKRRQVVKKPIFK